MFEVVEMKCWFVEEEGCLEYGNTSDNPYENKDDKNLDLIFAFASNMT
jgi:hypothetical protein